MRFVLNVLALPVSTFSFLSMVGAAPIAETKPLTFLTQAQSQIEESAWLLNYVPPNDGKPMGSGTAGGGRRGQCSFSGHPLLAMVYSESAIGTGRRLQQFNEPTLESHPTFWFYVPEVRNNLKINLRLQKQEDKRIVYEEDLEFSEEQTGSIAGFQLPESSEGLAVGEIYRWILQIDCDEDSPPIRVSALMERVVLDDDKSDDEFNTVINAREQISQLASSGLLHDTLSALAPLYMQSPDDYQPALESLLESANMSALAPVEVDNFLLLQAVD